MVLLYALAVITEALTGRLIVDSAMVYGRLNWHVIKYQLHIPDYWPWYKRGSLRQKCCYKINRSMLLPIVIIKVITTSRYIPVSAGQSASINFI